MSVPPCPQRTPEEILADFLGEHPDPSPAKVEALCAQHPDHASELCRLLKQPAPNQTATLFHS